MPLLWGFQLRWRWRIMPYRHLQQNPYMTTISPTWQFQQLYGQLQSNVESRIIHGLTYFQYRGWEIISSSQKVIMMIWSYVRIYADCPTRKQEQVWSSGANLGIQLDGKLLLNFWGNGLGPWKDVRSWWGRQIIGGSGGEKSHSTLMGLRKGFSRYIDALELFNLTRWVH